MATAYTPEEIAEIFEAYNNALKSGTPISEELAKQMQDAVKATRGLARAQEEFGKTLGRSALQLGNSLYKGEKGVGQFGDAIESAATALQTLILAIPGLGIAAKIGAVAIGALGKAANMAAKQGDALFKSYQDLSRAGATASDGITGVFRNMQNLGYGIEELDKMVQLVAQNSETLSKFSLTAADGANAFAEGMARIQRDGQLRDLGKTTDDINAAGAAYIRQSVRAGMSQRDIGDKLGAQTRAYILELDRLQRLTGMSAEALQKQQDEAMAEDAYNDVMSELKQRAAAGDEVAKMQIEKITTVMNKLGPEMRKEFVLGIGGDISAQQRLFMAAPNLMKDTMDETANTQKTINNLNRDAANTVGTFGRTARLAAGAYRDTFGPLYEMRETMVSTADFDARTAAAEKNAEVTDANTKRLSEAQIANMNARDSMQAFIQKGIAPATVALNALAKAASGAAGLGAKAVGAPEGGAAAGSSPGMGKMDYKKEFSTPTALSSATSAAPGKVAPGATSGKAAPIDTELVKKLTETGITGKREQANILAQIQRESGGVAKSENLNYSAERLLKTFPNRIKSLEEAQQLVAQGPEAIGNKIYGGRMGNAADEGFKYRGRGLIQLTGKENYAKYSKLLGIDLVKNPDLANDPKIAKDIAVAYFNEAKNRGVNLADIGAIGKAVGYVDIGGRETQQRAQLASQLEGQLPQAQFGGMMSGPMSGYPAMLHGTEAVVPLPDGKKIPVEFSKINNDFATQTGFLSKQLEKLDFSDIGKDFATQTGSLSKQLEKLELPNFTEGFTNQNTLLSQQLSKLTELVSAVQNKTGSADQSILMSQQLSKLDEIVRVMQTQVSVSSKILQAAN